MMDAQTGKTSASGLHCTFEHSERKVDPRARTGPLSSRAALPPGTVRSTTDLPEKGA